MSRLAVLLALMLPSAALAGTVKVLPGDVTLTGARATQRLLVVESEGGDVVADHTAKATFSSSDERIAKVVNGVVRAVGDGEAVVTAKIDDKTATLTVRVTKTKDDHEWSFRNHVIPMLTRAGCNSGACHGALAGKGGMKLSLRGYDPGADHFVLTRQAGGRRIDRQAPEKSLMLLKPTTALTHGGGQKLDPDGDDFRVVSEWIAAGAPGPSDKDVRIKRIEILPPSSVLKPKDTVQLLVRAWYGDGHSEDVTRWAKFTSSEELVANVSLDGKVTVAGHGEAAVSVWYSNKVASAVIVAPFPNKKIGRAHV